MTAEEYNQTIKDIEKTAEEAKKKVVIHYALSNNSVKEGDIVTDHKCTIRVDKVSVSRGRSYELPQCVYDGVILKKDGSDNVKGKRDTVYQSNMTNHKSI